MGHVHTSTILTTFFKKQAHKLQTKDKLQFFLLIKWLDINVINIYSNQP